MEHDATPLWYKDAVIYEVHVRAFADSNGDGIGDFQGLIGKLDYLQGLGVTAIWLLPFFPSPLRDDGYDISDYTGVHPAYGTLDDFRDFLHEAHKRDLRVIIELVLNHTSDQHPWFQRARTALPGSAERDFYVWSDTTERYQDARVIFQDYEASNWAWDPVANAYYWHRFYSHQPDLNYAHEPVREAVFEAVDFWLEMGVDGLRLDAVPYLLESEGTTSENLPATHAFLRELRAHIDARFPNRMLLAEANQWPEDAVAYFGDGDECHMAFHFPLMPRLFISLRTEDRLPLQDILAQTPAIPDTSQWAIFLRNHDELTLEMVTDEERLYMYEAFAPVEEARINLGIRRRLAPLLGNSRRRIELMNALLCSLPGTPVLYYGDEIGMGDNVYLGDRDGVRTPMQWNADRNAGFSAAPPQRLYLPLITDYEYHHGSVHVEAQDANPHSLLSFMKRLLAVRQQSAAFGRGTFRMLNPSNHHILAFIREHDDERLLVVANLSRFSQSMDLDLQVYTGMTPVEMFGHIPFRVIGEEPYPLTIGPHSFYWFRLTPSASDVALVGDHAGEHPVATLDVNGDWQDILLGSQRSQLERILPDLIKRQPWIRRSPHTMLNARVVDAVEVPQAEQSTWIVPVRVAYSDRDPEMYLLAMTFDPDDVESRDRASESAIATVHSVTEGDAVIIDAVGQLLVDGALRWLADSPGTPLDGIHGHIAVEETRQESGVRLPEAGTPVSFHSGDAGSNPVYQSDRVVIKFLRRLSEGMNPEWEVGQALTEAGFPHIPTVLGALQYRRPQQPQMTLAVIQAYVPNDGHAWDASSQALADLIAGALADGVVIPTPGPIRAREMMAPAEAPEQVVSLFAPSLHLAGLLGRRTAELHRALGGITALPAFRPEPYTVYDRRSIYQSMRNLTARTLRELRNAMPRLDPEDRRLAGRLVDAEGEFYDRLGGIMDLETAGYRLRVHGDFHLGQVLLTGDDVLFVDFEGESDRFLEERRLKSSPLRDVASMLHSYRVVGQHAVAYHPEAGNWSPEQAGSVRSLVLAWYQAASRTYLREYLRVAEEDGHLPARMEDRARIIDALLFERAVYDLEYALLHHRTHLTLPLMRLAELLEA